MVTHGSRLVFIVTGRFYSYRSVFHGFRWLLLVIQGSWVFFHGSGWVLWFCKVLGWFFIIPGKFLWVFKVFMVPSGFSRFFKVSGWFFEVPGGF